MGRSAIEKRVSTLEEEMREMVRQVTLLAISARGLKDEMKEFKDEMATWCEESERRRKALEESTEEFKREMKEFKDEMRAFKDEMNKKWGWVINKLGTMVEDLIYPSMEGTLEKYFGCKPDRKMIRVEFGCVEIDALAICQDQRKAFIVEAKSHPDNAFYIDKFKEKLSKVKDCIEWLKDYKIYAIYAGWNMKEETIERLTESGIYAMIVKGDILTIVNSDITPAVW